ncbi:MAG: hypothetical protein KAH07_09945 [Flavobacteriaceae bacterium]|nr:hypothetical protein [Flavobacteriaceae bacterium]
MKKITFILLVALSIGATTSYGQATKQLNLGLIGVSYEIPLSEAITIAPVASTNLGLDYLTLGVKSNYYFDTLFKLPAAWDVYGGAGVGFALGLDDNNGNNDSDLDIGLQVGGRWFWNDKWGVYLEFGGGHTSGGTAGLGVTMKL